MNFIKHVIEFNKLFLVWQSPFDSKRTRYVVAEMIRQDHKDNKVLLRYLKESRDFKEASKLGFDGYPAFNLERDVHDVGVVDTFMRRLPPRTRSDFPQYLEALRLKPDVDISDFALLGYSTAKLLSDSFQIIPSFEAVNESCEFLLEVAGFHYTSKIKMDNIQLDSDVIFQREPQNEVDPNAIAILIDQEKIGYVTRAHLPSFHRWLKENYEIKACVEKKNGLPQAPSLYLFVQISQNNGAAPFTPFI